MRNRFVAGKLKRRWTVWGVGYFKPPGETLSRKPRAVASQRWVSGWAAVPRASSQQSQGQGLGGTRGGTDTKRPPQPTQGPRQSEPQLFRQPSSPQIPEIQPQGYTHIRRAGGRPQPLLSLTAQQQKEESHPPFFSLLLKSLLPHKALSHTWFFPVPFAQNAA